jgi:hypothetical protein
VNFVSSPTKALQQDYRRLFSLKLLDALQQRPFKFSAAAPFGQNPKYSLVSTDQDREIENGEYKRGIGNKQ